MKEFSSLPVQGLDGYLEDPDPTLWYARLQKSSEPEGKFTLSPKPGVLDIFQGTSLKFDPHPFALPFGPLSCAISSNTIAYPAKPAGVYKPGEVSSSLHWASISSLNMSHTTPRAIGTLDHTGQCLHPAFSPDGDLLAFTRGETSSNSASDRKLYVMNTADEHAYEVILKRIGKPVYVKIESLLWSHNGKDLFVCSTRYGRRSLVKITIHEGYGEPRTIFNSSSVSSVCRLPNDRLMITTSSFACPSKYMIYDFNTQRATTLDKVDLNNYGIGDHQISEFCCDGGNGEDIQTWVVSPSFLEPGQKYPLALFIHGGPIWPETNSWLARWNALLIAEQGYIVVLPNFGGSPGVSSHFKQKVLGHFGDITYRDIEACMQYVKQKIPFADTERATALGGSFGGFMTFWMAGKPLAKKFRAMVSHAGIFNAPSLAGTDVPDAWRFLLGGVDQNRDLIEALSEWDPARYSHKWSTPMLMLVGEKDRRISCVNRIGAFSALQFRGVESRLLVFPDEGHIISKPANLLNWYEAVIAWINKHTSNN